jgi:cytochrome c peroxidase
MKTVLKLFFISLGLIIYISCAKDDAVKNDPATEQAILAKYLDLPANPFNYTSPDLPAFYNDQFIKIQDNTPAGNPVTNWGATLGRVLFYDKRLSKNNTISCSSCHAQETGFTDPKQFSDGFNGGLSKRHSMSLINARYYVNGRFFWDERAATLEDQVLMPIQDQVEMGMRLDTLVKRLKGTEFYPILFKYAFGNETINEQNISRALAQFVRSMVSYSSRYDEGRAVVNNRVTDFPNFTAEENQGKNIFMTNARVNCSGCHTTDAFIMDNPRNNGLDASNPDSGIFVHSKDANDIGKFKVPSLRNVAQRERFMHDGSIQGLQAVIEHYNSFIQMSPTLDPHLINSTTQGPERMNLSQAEKDALIAFLKTLTDEKITSDKKFSSPFR